ncbi:Hypothetical predicted protein [Mytilus galloprovincialis]|uniref:B box-type domain-containing protein n=1 Tax=Mytilus galloprovincialis TaxID=29158 RepID=A0A8B6HTS6_MYTGA|nr:Hypothetical predicted protein [Mytilus galloprovincialis]
MSGSIQEFAISCQGCPEQNPIKGRCLTCNLFMCMNCCMLHQVNELNLYNQHKIVDIEITGSTDQRYDSIVNCELHRQRGCGFCKQCEDVVCTMCVSQPHRDHYIIDMDSGCTFSLYKLKARSSKYQEIIVEMFRHQNTLGSMKQSGYSTLETEVQNIQKQGKTLKDAIDAHTNKLLLELGKKWEAIKNDIEKEEKKTTKYGIELEEKNNNLTNIVDSKCKSAVFEAARTEMSFDGKIDLQTEFNSLPEFNPGKVTECGIESLYGIIKHVQELKSTTNTSLSVLESYKSKFPSIDNIVCCPDRSVLINAEKSYGFEGELHHVKLFNGSLEKIHKFSVDFKSMALLPSGDLLLSTEETALRTISAENKLEKSKYSVAPLKTTGALHITSDGNIIVGVTDKYVYSREDNIIVMNLYGEHIKSYRVYNSKQPQFGDDSMPFKITSDKSRNIYIIVRQESIRRNGRLFVLTDDDNGEFKCIYKGSESSVCGTFDPTDLVVTESSRVIVCDAANLTLHILNTSGQCLSTQNLIKMDIKRTPNCLAIDHRGFVLLGCKGLNQKDAELHVMKLSTM